MFKSNYTPEQILIKNIKKLILLIQNRQVNSKYKITKFVLIRSKNTEFQYKKRNKFLRLSVDIDLENTGKEEMIEQRKNIHMKLANERWFLKY